MMGGGMMMQRPMYKDGSKVKKLSKLSGLSKKEVAKKMFELSGKTSKKIKRFVGADGGRTNYRGGGLATSGYGKVMKS